MKKIFKNIFLIFVLILIIYFLYNFISLKNKITNNPETNQHDSPFSIAKIKLYNSAFGENKNTNFNQSNWILDIFQYTDIALYISSDTAELSSHNSIKNLSIDNINISSPKIGNPSLYYLDSLNFGTSNINKNYEIKDSLEFTVLNDSNEENNILYNTPVFFSDCSNPITLKYVNNSVKENFVVNSPDPVAFNGKLLELSNTDLNDLETTLNFRINIQNFDNQKYYCDLSIPITLKNNTENIYDGSFYTEENYTDLKFVEK